MHLADGAAVYRPRKPQESLLWQLLNEHFHHFLSEYESRFQKTYGFFRQVVSNVVQNFLECGDLKQGFGVSLRSLTWPGAEEPFRTVN